MLRVTLSKSISRERFRIQHHRNNRRIRRIDLDRLSRFDVAIGNAGQVIQSNEVCRGPRRRHFQPEALQAFGRCRKRSVWKLDELHNKGDRTPFTRTSRTSVTGVCGLDCAFTGDGTQLTPAIATISADNRHGLVARDGDRRADFTIANFGHKCQVGVGCGKGVFAADVHRRMLPGKTYPFKPLPNDTFPTASASTRAWPVPVFVASTNRRPPDL
ncbi:hypothetical protein ACFSHP_00465 [Novosphingobium panipatense]